MHLKKQIKLGVNKKKKKGLSAKLDKLAAMYDENAGKTSAMKQYQAMRRKQIYAAKTLCKFYFGNAMFRGLSDGC